MRISDADLRAPDVTLEFTEGQYFRWPQELVDAIHAYGIDERIERVRLASGKTTRKYRIKIAAYRYRDEIEPLVRQLHQRLT
jgi:hypothetical protein